MHSEYAVDPAVIGANWATFKDLFDRFGFEKGRLITRMPAKWSRMVIEAAEVARVPDLDKARIIELLRKGKRHRLARFQRSYDPDKSWIDNALREHDIELFRAIICNSETKVCLEALSSDECTDDHSLMHVDVSQDVARTPEAIARALLPLAMSSMEIDLVDPYFDYRPGKDDYIGALKCLLAALADIVRLPKAFRIHYRKNIRPSRPHIAKVAHEWNKLARDVVPEGCTLTLHGWKVHKNSKYKLHDRHFLTEIGGIMSGAGFAAIKPLETTTFSFHGFKHAQLLRERFNSTSSGYHKAEPSIAVDSKGAKIVDE